MARPDLPTPESPSRSTLAFEYVVVLAGARAVLPQSLMRTSSVAPASTSTSRSSAALTASLVKWAATLGDGGSLYHSWVGLCATDHAKSSPVTDQINAVSRP